MAHSKAHLYADPAGICHVIAGYGKALAHPVRVLITQFLSEHGPRFHHEIQCFIGLSNATVSHHLRFLVRYGIIEANIMGTYIEYSLNNANLPVMRAYLLDFLNDLN